MDYTYSELTKLLINATEISQDNNANANSQLYILENGLVFKLFIPESDYLQNVRNLFCLKEYGELKSVKEVVLPVELIRMEEDIIGYFMPYVKGRTLTTFLHDSTILPEKKLNVFVKLASAINKLPEGVYVGDLHAKNVLVDADYEVYLIDIDGFSTENGETFSVPQPLPNVRKKYYNKLGEPIVSRNSDIYCLYSMFIDWIGNGFSLLEGKYRKKYLSYLHHIEGGKLLAHQLKILYNKSDNIISPEAFRQIDVTRIFADEYPEKIKTNKKNTKANLKISLWERRTR